jgi:hypothetical protein
MAHERMRTIRQRHEGKKTPVIVNRRANAIAGPEPKFNFGTPMND